LWDFGDGNFSSEQNPTHIYETPGDYTAVLQLSDNCLTVEENIEVSIDCEIPQADFDYVTNGTNVQFSTVSAADYYAWSFGDGNFSSEQNPEHNYDVSVPSMFDVMLSLYNSCGSDSQTQSIGVLSAETGNLPGIELYPNPANNFLTVQFSGSGQYQMQMQDISGKVINNTRTSQTIYKIDMQNLTSGLYFLKITKDEHKAVFKVIKQ
jgi:PKD repeat protein